MPSTCTASGWTKPEEGRLPGAARGLLGPVLPASSSHSCPHLPPHQQHRTRENRVSGEHEEEVLECQRGLFPQHLLQTAVSSAAPPWYFHPGPTRTNRLGATWVPRGRAPGAQRGEGVQSSRYVMSVLSGRRLLPLPVRCRLNRPLAMHLVFRDTQRVSQGDGRTPGPLAAA